MAAAVAEAGGVPESMCYGTEEAKKEPVLGWYGSHDQLEKDTRELRSDGGAETAEPAVSEEEDKKDESPEALAARQRKQRILTALKKPTTDQLRRRFTEFDLNSDGTLDKSEVRRLVRQGRPKTSEGEVEEIFKQLDKNGDGRVSFNELVAWVFSAEGPDAEESERLFSDRQKSRRGSAP
ncbi:CML16 [Symbiodinium sp. CCMP2592]|nr:CML16 [Symbiodinium sp. CCMP2592]